MSRLGSPAYQVKNALNKIFTPGASRHRDKQHGLDGKRIYSIGTMRTYVQDGVRFAKWARTEYKIKDIRKLTPEMARAYLQSLSSKNRSGGYLGRVKAAIVKLGVALTGEGWKLGDGWHSQRRPERTYSPENARQIVVNLREHARDPQVAEVACLQVIGGLRRQEAVQLRGQDIDVDRCILRLERGTKGGRSRIVLVDKKYQGYLQAVKKRAGLHSDGHVFQSRGGLGRRVERAVDEACKRLGVQDQGTHGFRGTFANVRYGEYRAAGATDREARRMLAVDLGHGRVGVTYSYVA